MIIKHCFYNIPHVCLRKPQKASESLNCYADMPEMRFRATFSTTNNTNTPLREQPKILIWIVFILMLLFLDEGFISEKNSSIGLKSSKVVDTPAYSSLEAHLFNLITVMK
jgi:hypothetical protein